MLSASQLGGQHYLEKLRAIVSPRSLLCPCADPDRDRWITQAIDPINAHLTRMVADTLDWLPFPPPMPQVFAAPLQPELLLDAIVLLDPTPIVLIDIGRVMPEHWQRVVVHEVAHLVAGSPGHHPAFERALAHLCLAFQLPPPHPPLDRYPPIQPTANPIGIWKGEPARPQF